MSECNSERPHHNDAPATAAPAETAAEALAHVEALLEDADLLSCYPDQRDVAALQAVAGFLRRLVPDR